VDAAQRRRKRRRHQHHQRRRRGPHPLSQKKQRVAASTQLTGPTVNITTDKAELVKKVHDALYASKIISYAQGLDLIRTMGEKKGWGLDLGRIAAIWRGGCIIRARFLNRITDAYRTNPDLANLMLDPFFKDVLSKTQQNWREVVSIATLNGIPVPAFSASLGYYDSYRAARLPANLLQAQRDFFGAHTYERTDKPEGQMFHTDWPEVIGLVPPAAPDSIGGIDPQPGEHIGMVGLFPPLVRQVTARGARLTVLELRADLAGENVGFTVTLDPKDLDGCDKVLSTSTVLLNHTLDMVLANCRKARHIALIGPGAGCLPEVLFKAGVTTLGGTWITDASGFKQALNQGQPWSSFARKFAWNATDWRSACIDRSAQRRT
jgi:hypothetical protein